MGKTCCSLAKNQKHESLLRRLWEMDVGSGVVERACAALSLPEPPVTTTTTGSDCNITASSENNCTPVDLIAKIVQVQEELRQLKRNNDSDQALLDLSEPEVHFRGLTKNLTELCATLEELTSSKDRSAAALRHPVVENSIPISHSLQIQLIQILDILKSLHQRKTSNQSTKEWIENQDWEEFGKSTAKDLQTRILTLDYLLSKSDTYPTTAAAESEAD